MIDFFKEKILNTAWGGLLLLVLIGAAGFWIDGQFNKARRDAVERYVSTQCEFIIDYSGRDAYYKCPSGEDMYPNK